MKAELNSKSMAPIVIYSIIITGVVDTGNKLIAVLTPAMKVIPVAVDSSHK